MFERFSEKARRSVFFGRYEASQYGSPSIETEHLLLGLFREDKALAKVFLRPPASVEWLRKEIEARIEVRTRTSTSDEVPLSRDSKRALNFAAEEAERLGHNILETGHILAGLLRVENSMASQLLHLRGISLSAVQAVLAKGPTVHAPIRSSPGLLRQVARDLTEVAIEGKLSPALGREKEITELVEVLASLNHRNPVLIGEQGLERMSILEGLAQRFADGEVPPALDSKRIFSVELRRTAATPGQKSNDRLADIVKELSETRGIMLIEDMQTLAELSGVIEALKPSLMRNEIQCILTGTSRDYRNLLRALPWLDYCCRVVMVQPLDANKVFLVLEARRGEYEKFHGVQYSKEALECAVRLSEQYFPDGTLLAKAMEVLDAAGSRVKLRKTKVPNELAELQKRVRLLSRQMERAIAAHEFVQARKLADEEHEAKERLLDLRKKLKVEDTAPDTVAGVDVKNVISDWLDISNILKADADPPRKAFSGQVSIPSLDMGEASPLQVFLCHSSDDKPVVRGLYNRLKEKSEIKPWLDEEDLLPGQDWDFEISNAVRSSDVVVVCLSRRSVTKAGYVQKEIKKVLDVADQQPEGAIYVIPLKLEECDVPAQIRRWHWVNFFEPKGFEKLMEALRRRAGVVGGPLA